MSTKFNQSFKMQAVEKALTRPDGTTLVETAKRLEISISSLTRWITEARDPAHELLIDMVTRSYLKSLRWQ